MERYLKETRMINYSDESIQNLIKNRGWKELDTYECLKSIYNFVRDFEELDNLITLHQRYEMINVILSENDTFSEQQRCFCL